MNWTEYFFNLAITASTKSKDRSTKVGAVIVGPDHDIRSLGFNGFPRGVNDDIDERHQRPTKYMFTSHAEENAIITCARNGVCTLGCSIYVYPLMICSRCARNIIQAGIKEVHMMNISLAKGSPEEYVHGLMMMKEAGLKIISYDENYNQKSIN